MDARYFITLQEYVRPGDQAVVYAQRGRFVAVVEFIGEHFYSEQDVGWTKEGRKFLFPYRIRFKVIHESASPTTVSYSTDETSNKAQWLSPNLIDKITFIADKGKTWNQYLQVSIIRITEEDSTTISDAIIKS